MNMEYKNTIEATFISRPNRFIAQVEVCGRPETVHVKNTGRCKELLLPGARVILAKGENPARKTKYDLICVHKPGLGWVNIDSAAPNRVVAQWLAGRDLDLVRPECTYGDSRLDFYIQRGPERIFMEVKGCTLELDGVGYFPDAPTQRGVKHLHTLATVARAGYRAIAAFVIQMNGIYEVRPNIATHPQFGAALAEAKAAGVEVVFFCCRVTPDTLTIEKVLPQTAL